MTDIAISTDTAEMLAIYATRYALGRRSPAVHSVASWVASIAHHLTPGGRADILWDIRQQRQFCGLGDACDIEDWEMLERRLLELGVEP